jgi:hypothetical protein
VNSAAVLEYPALHAANPHRSNPEQRLWDYYWRTAGSPAAVLVMLPTMMNANAAAPIGVMT